MSSYDEIKKLISNSKKMLNKNITEGYTEIKNLHKIYEQSDSRVNVLDDIKNDIDYETAEDEDDDKKSKSDKSKSYRISGGIITIHSKDKNLINITTDDKIAFQETMDEFMTDVDEIVDFNKLNLYDSTVEWSGVIQSMDINFYLSIGESNGVYIDGKMMKLDDDFLNMVNKLRTFYEKFKSKWSKVLSNRKKTKI